MTEALTNGAAPTPTAPPKSTTDQMIDDALGFLSDSTPENDNQKPPGRKPPTKKPPEPEPQPDEEVPLEPVAPGDDEPDVEPEDEPEDTGQGSRDEPFTIKDLPDNKFIELKVDGEKTVVSLQELASGYIREKTFSARINKTQYLTNQAQAALGKAKEVQDRVRTEFQAFVRDPDQIFDFFLASEDREKVLEAVAQRYALMLRRFREAPHEKLAYQRQRDQQRLQWERDQFESHKRAELEQRQRAESAQRAQAIFRPGWEDGLRRAGFPQPTQQLWDEVLVRVRQRADSGHQITSEDVSEFVVRAAKLLELPPKGKRPAPAPKPQLPRARRADNTNGHGKDWSAMPAHERRKDPDYFLRTLKAKDFR